VVWSFVYVAFCRLLQLVVLLVRSERSKELDILVFRHELAVLRGQPRRALFRPVDRAILAAFARSLPRSAWAGLSERPACRVRKSTRHAARTYSWISPPSRSRRWSWSGGFEATRRRRVPGIGGVSPRARCGLWVL
jgi:hypothetical protein